MELHSILKIETLSPHGSGTYQTPNLGMSNPNVGRQDPEWQTLGGLGYLHRKPGYFRLGRLSDLWAPALQLRRMARRLFLKGIGISVVSLGTMFRV